MPRRKLKRIKPRQPIPPMPELCICGTPLADAADPNHITHELMRLETYHHIALANDRDLLNGMQFLDVIKEIRQRFNTAPVYARQCDSLWLDAWAKGGHEAAVSLRPWYRTPPDERFRRRWVERHAR